MAVNVVSFSFSWCSIRGPGAQLSVECWLSLPHLVSNFSGPPTQSGAPRAPSAGCSFPYHISSITRLLSNSNCLTSVLTVLYNSSTPTQSPTRSLEWHVWSSSSGNNCHAVHRSLCSGASVYECTMGILACPILLANFRPRDSSHNCVTSFRCITLEWHFWPGRRSKYNN